MLSFPTACCVLATAAAWSAHALQQTAFPSAEVSVIHDIVGPRGVFVISLRREPQRLKFTQQKLSQVGIVATPVDAIDALTATQRVLNWGANVTTNRVVKAISASHRVALDHARRLHSHLDWALILEDDAVPVNPAQFNAGFAKAWESVTPDTLMVRLQWKLSEDADETLANSPRKDVGFGTQVRSGFSGNDLTGAYMVRRSAITDIVKRIFPCPSAIDACYEWRLYKQPLSDGRMWFDEHLLLFDSEHAGMLTERMQCPDAQKQHGVFVQAHLAEEGMASTRDQWDKTHSLDRMPTAGRSHTCIPDASMLQAVGL